MTPQTDSVIRPLAPGGQANSILVIGEALVDCFPDGDVIGGAPFNLARNLGAFGAAATMITRLGNDERGRALRAECRRFKLPDDGVQCDAVRPTGHVDVVMAGTGHRFVIAENAAWDVIDPLDAAAIARRTQPAIVCFGTLAQRAPESRAAIAAVLDEAQTNRALRVLDLNLRAATAGDGLVDIAAWSLCHADVAKVNDDELAQLFDWFVPDVKAGARDWGGAAQRHAVAQLLTRFPLRNLIVTRGAEGYTAFDSGGAPIANGMAADTVIVDTVGAGDAFTSIVVLGESLGWPLSLTLYRANYFAAAVCSLRGAVASDPDFYRRWAERWDLPQTVRLAATQT